MTDQVVRCPICTVDLPAPDGAFLTPEGLSTSVDTSFVNEHMEMHEKCTCTWHVLYADDTTILDVKREHDDECEVHA